MNFKYFSFNLEFALLIGLVLLSSSSVWAFETSMLNDTIVLGEAQQTTLTIINTEKNPLAIEVSPVKRKYTRDGAELFNLDTTEVVTVPSQMILNPGEEQVVAIRWIGPVNLEKEQAFRILVENVPIELSTSNIGTKSLRASGQIRMVYRVVKSFYVEPPNAVSKLEVLQSDWGVKKDALDVVLTNAGTMHQLVHRIALDVTFSKPGASSESVTFPVTYDEHDLDGGYNFMVGEERLIHLPLRSSWKVSKDYQTVTVVIKKIFTE